MIIPTPGKSIQHFLKNSQPTRKLKTEHVTFFPLDQLKFAHKNKQFDKFAHLLPY